MNHALQLLSDGSAVGDEINPALVTANLDEVVSAFNITKDGFKDFTNHGGAITATLEFDTDGHDAFKVASQLQESVLFDEGMASRSSDIRDFREQGLGKGDDSRKLNAQHDC